jgi:hypothetical protein
MMIVDIAVLNLISLVTALMFGDCFDVDIIAPF